MMTLNRLSSGLWLLVALASAAGANAQISPTPISGPVPQAPPTAPPPITPGPPLTAEGGPVYGPGQSLWSIGQPTDEEQLYLEYMNRSRANPPLEGVRLAATTDPDVLSAYNYFQVNLGLMQSQFDAIAAAPPLAMNERLLIAARLHSGDMYANQFQGHTGSNGSNLGDRLTAQGYTYANAGENVYSYASSVWHGHAGFNVDWGTNPPTLGGMQSPPGHRNNIHNAAMREVGVGIYNGINGPVGPQLVTQDFGTRSGNSPLISGVVYYDFNGNSFYDIGEGIGGVSVEVPGSAFYAVTADSGGYAIPVSSNGNYAISFAASGLNHATVAAVTGGLNVKVDYVPTYSPPQITGPSVAALNQPNSYTFSPVGAATAYQWQQAIVSTYSTIEGAETLDGVTIESTPGYSVQSSDSKASGAYAFHLAHPEPDSQYVTLNAAIRLTATSALNFSKRLGWAGIAQVAKAQVSIDNGGSWQDVWSQTGTGGAGETSFSPVNVSLAALAGQSVRLRFAYTFTGGSYFPQSSAGVGLYLDDIAVSNAEQLLNVATADIPAGTSFTFTPTVLTNYLLTVRARINSRVLNWGPPLPVSAAMPPPSIQLVGKPILAGNQVQVDFTVANYAAGMTFQLWRAASPEAAWSQDNSAVLSTMVPQSKFRLTTTTAGANQMFYRVSASN